MNGKDDERAMLLEDVAIPIAEERDRLAAELAEVKAVLVELHRTMGPALDASTRSAWLASIDVLHERARAIQAVYALAERYAAEAKR